MQKRVPFFPTITEARLKECGVDIGTLTASYRSNVISYPLTVKSETDADGKEIGGYNIEDSRGEWNPIHFETVLRRHIRIERVSSLFGPTGVAPKDARLGVAVLLSSLASNHRYAVQVLDFGSDSVDVEGTFSFTLKRSFWREQLNCSVVFYLKTPGHPQAGETPLANESGMLLGTIDEFSVFLDGTGSLFPIKTISEPGKPLWWVSCDWSDPFDDPFNEENVCILLNRAHSNYGLLREGEAGATTPFLADVIASALQIIIQKALDSVGSEALHNTEAITPGSILDAVRYFVKTFEYDVSSPEKLALTIRQDLDGRM